MSKCHRVAKLKEILHENTRRLDDDNFFYKFLKKPKAQEQRYVCYVTEYCNEGNLDMKVDSNNGGLSKEEVILYGSQIMEGLL